MSQPTVDAGRTALAWEEAKCRVPMWIAGSPAGFCGERAFGHQLPKKLLWHERNWMRGDAPYCFGHCCPNHGGPHEGQPIVFHDGYTHEGRQMWCAVMPGFTNLQESEAGFSGDPVEAVTNLRAALSATRSTGDQS